MNLRNSLQDRGHAWARAAISEAELRRIEAAVETDGRAGRRIDVNSELAAICGPSSDLGRVVDGLLPGAWPVRCVAFEKSAGSNWSLAWHQDRIIAVKDRAAVAGFDNWSLKQGTWHCEPPVSVLKSMLFVRLHLDPCDAQNGAMQVLEGSHQRGKVTKADIPALCESLRQEDCSAERGDVQFLDMLTLHRSGLNRNGHPRRALRIDYANAALPLPLKWAAPAAP